MLVIEKDEMIRVLHEEHEFSTVSSRICWRETYESRRVSPVLVVTRLKLITWS